MKKTSSLSHIGENLRTLREELGLTMREAAKDLRISHTMVYRYEKEGFFEPPWMRFAELYSRHPDLRGAGSPGFELFRADLILSSPLYSSLMSVYGRDGLPGALSKRTNREVLEDLREMANDCRWREEDVECMRVRTGVKPRRIGGFRKKEDA